MKQPRVLADKIPLHRHLTESGDGLGTKSFITDLSSTPTTIYVQPPADEIFVIQNLLVLVNDKGKFTQDGFGANPTLINGVIVQVTDGVSTLVVVTDGHPIKSNSDFLQMAGLFHLVNFDGTDDSLAAGFTADQFGMSLVLNGTANHRLEVLLHDNFVGIEMHEYIVRGYRQKIMV